MAAALLLAMAAPCAWAQETSPDSTQPARQALEFDPAFLQGLGVHDREVDLGLLGRNAELVPGDHTLTLRLNGVYFERRVIRVVVTDDGATTRPCLSLGLLRQMGVRLEAFMVVDGREESECIDLEATIPDAKVTLDAEHLALDLSVPQIALPHSPLGYVDPQEWDDGINAGFVNYQFSGSQGRTDRAGSDHQYSLYLNAGLNVGGWRLRSNSYLTRDVDGERRYERALTYLERDLPGTRGRLTMGESFTPTEVFDSIPFRGVQVSSDTGMLPDSLQGFAPVIRGIAETRAKVEVRQNGFSLYTTYVAPGPFAIEDLTSAAGNGDLEVVITEADGRERRFRQAYAAVPNMLREGGWRYSATAGQYNVLDWMDRPGFVQGTLMRGLRHDTTLYGGVLGSDFYRAVSLGVGKNLGVLGALSFDVSQARTQRPTGGADHGQSYRIQYGKAFGSRTNLRFAGYRYSTQAYRDFAEAVRQQNPEAYDGATRRTRLEASLMQGLGVHGSLYLTASRQSYWGDNDGDELLQLGYNAQYRGVSYGLNYSQVSGRVAQSDHQIALTASFPLGNFSRSRASASYGLTRDYNGRLNHRAGVTGTLGEENRVRYAVEASHDADRGNGGAVSLGYLPHWGQLGASYTAGEDYRRATVNVSGAVLVHRDGVLVGQSLGETVAVAEVTGVSGVGIRNAPAARTNANGYALVPYVVPYRRNRVLLDTGTLDPNVDVDNAVVNVVPRRGAVVKARFAATTVQKLVVNLRLADGTPPPFGAEVHDADDQIVGMVAQAGQVLLTLGAQRAFTVRWGQASNQRCEFHLDQVAPTASAALATVPAVCRGEPDLMAATQENMQ